MLILYIRSTYEKLANCKFFSCHKSSSIFIPEWFDVRLVVRDGSTTTRVELTSQCSDPISSYPQVLSLKSWNFEFHNFFVENLVTENDNKCRHLATVEYRKITQPFVEARRMSQEIFNIG